MKLTLNSDARRPAEVPPHDKRQRRAGGPPAPPSEEQTIGTIHYDPRLAALLAMSAGALAGATTTQAAIIHEDLGDVQVGFGGAAEFTLDLLGVHDAVVQRDTLTPGDTTTHHIVRLGPTNPGNPGAFQAKVYSVIGTVGLYFPFGRRLDAGKKWSTIAGPTGSIAYIGARSDFDDVVVGVGSFSEKYIAFSFEANPGQTRYGWIRLSLDISDAMDPLVTLHEWAYDDSGAEILTGVPEPQQSALAMGAALVLGAAGLRAWRKRKQAVAAAD